MNFMNFNFEIDKLWGTYFIPAIFLNIMKYQKQPLEVFC